MNCDIRELKRIVNLIDAKDVSPHLHSHHLIMVIMDMIQNEIWSIRLLIVRASFSVLP